MPSIERFGNVIRIDPDLENSSMRKAYEGVLDTCHTCTLLHECHPSTYKNHETIQITGQRIAPTGDDEGCVFTRLAESQATQKAATGLI